MKLDRNLGVGRGKYALVLLRKLNGLPSILLNPTNTRTRFLRWQKRRDFTRTRNSQIDYDHPTDRTALESFVSGDEPKRHHEFEQDAITLGRLMAEHGFHRETSFIDEELRAAFFQAYDEAKVKMAEERKAAA